jgi:hypothetical protein
MSRTDVHTPLWVKELQPEWRHFFREDHDHRTGRCDLDEYRAAGRTWVRTSCSISLARCDRNICCGCLLCTGRDEQRADRRRSRHEARLVCHDLRRLHSGHSPTDEEDP